MHVVVFVIVFIIEVVVIIVDVFVIVVVVVVVDVVVVDIDDVVVVDDDNLQGGLLSSLLGSHQAGKPSALVQLSVLHVI